MSIVARITRKLYFSPGTGSYEREFITEHDSCANNQSVKVNDRRREEHCVLIFAFAPELSFASNLLKLK